VVSKDFQSYLFTFPLVFKRISATARYYLTVKTVKAGRREVSGYDIG
jgi:hypothetical protein